MICLYEDCLASLGCGGGVSNSADDNVIFTRNVSHVCVPDFVGRRKTGKCVWAVPHGGDGRESNVCGESHFLLYPVDDYDVTGNCAQDFYIIASKDEARMTVVKRR